MNTLNYIKKRFNLKTIGPGTEIIGSRKKELPEMFRDLGFTTGAEIGVEIGLYSEIICKQNPELTLFCIDPWKVYPEYRAFVDQEVLNEFYEQTLVRLKPFNCKIIRSFSENAYKKFENRSLDFVYIDGNHDFLHVIQDICYWLPKIKPQGIIAGHDFHYKTRNEVNQVESVVRAVTSAFEIDPWFILKEQKGSSSWFWIKK